MPNDRKLPKLTQKQLEIANVLRYMDERMLNIIEQIRAVAIAAGVSPEDFQKAFSDKEAQDQFYIKLHVAEDNYELQEKAKIAEEDAKLGESPTGTLATIDANLGEFAAPSFPEPKGLQSK